jgi:hypothetical protein
MTDCKKDNIYGTYGLGRDPCTRGTIKCRNYHICKNESLACVDFLKFVGIRKWETIYGVLDMRQPSREVYAILFSAEYNED